MHILSLLSLLLLLLSAPALAQVSVLERIETKIDEIIKKVGAAPIDPPPPAGPIISPPPPPAPPAPVTDDCDAKVFPCAPANTRIVIVAADGSGNHRELQPALTDAKPGDTIQIKNGIYSGPTTPGCPGQGAGAFCIKAHGTQSQPITLMAFPGHEPTITAQLTGHGSWWLIQGLDFTSTNNGLAFYFYEEAGSTEKARHITLRNNRIHDTPYMGLFFYQPYDLLLEGNTFDRNGMGGPVSCDKNTIWGNHTSGGFGGVHCHGVYLGQHPGYPGPSNVIVRRNKFISNTGSGFQTRMDGKSSSGLVIENNLFINNQRAMNLSTLANSLVRNNTVIVTDYPRINTAEKSCWFMHSTYTTKFSNNACYIFLADSETVWPIHGYDGGDPARYPFANNAFFVNGKRNWVWGGQNQGDFIATWKGQTGDKNGIGGYVTEGDGSEAGFVSMKDFNLLPGSALVGKGADCPAVNIDGKPRTACNIGAY